MKKCECRIKAGLGHLVQQKCYQYDDMEHLELDSDTDEEAECGQPPNDQHDNDDPESE